MIIRCDVCGRFYKDFEDCHDFGEENFCCDHCLWVASHDEGELQPKHTCTEIKPKEKVEFT